VLFSRELMTENTAVVDLNLAAEDPPASARSLQEAASADASTEAPLGRLVSPGLAWRRSGSETTRQWKVGLPSAPSAVVRQESY
jgi:hypothetical protein